MTLIDILLHLTGLVLSVFALWRSRTPQGAAAWSISLIALPKIFIPFFLIFGRSKFQGKVISRKKLDETAKKELNNIEDFFEHIDALHLSYDLISKVARESRQIGLTRFNKTKLLIDTKEAYPEMLSLIENAKEYILFQFYIFREDETGKTFAEALKTKAREGVRVYFLCDKIGTKLSSGFIREMTDAGIKVRIFHSSKDWASAFQINFRNHRKILIADGAHAIIGGMNIGDDYQGKYPEIGAWRDTAISLKGPSALATQLSFLKDWHWATDKIINLNWTPVNAEEDSSILVHHSGPSDDSDGALLLNIGLIQSARDRVWIANPYFVPPESFINSLILASLRGVDVKIIVPSYSDNWMVFNASQIYIEKLLRAGIKVYRYLPGLLHQKVILIDDISAVGSTNIDMRSFFLNFEINAYCEDGALAQRMEQMLLNDLQNSEEISLTEIQNRSLFSQFSSRFANLFSPIL